MLPFGQLVYGQPDGAIAVSDTRLTDDEARRMSKLISRLPELVELERDRNKAKSRHQPQPLRFKPVTIGDLNREVKLLEVHCGACRPDRHLYINLEIGDDGGMGGQVDQGGGHLRRCRRRAEALGGVRIPP